MNDTLYLYYRRCVDAATLYIARGKTREEAVELAITEIGEAFKLPQSMRDDIRKLMNGQHN